jgi:hypothetical protein
MKSFKTCASMLLLFLSASAAHASEPEDTAGLVANLAYDDCSEQTALVILPVAVMPKLPPGFSYTTPAGDTLLAAIHISGSRCASVDGDGQARDLLAFAQVRPPAALVDPAISFYAIALGGYTNRLKTQQKFESWGITDLIERGTVTIDLTVLPLARIGKVKAQGATSCLTTQMTAVGSPSTLAGGHTRAYYVRNGVLISSFDAVYTAQKSMNAVGSVIPLGAGFLPPGIFPAVGTHAFDYDLTVGFVQTY